MGRGEGFCWVGKKKTYSERHGSSDFYASEVKGLFKNRWLFRDWPVLMWITLELAAFRKLSLPLGVSCERLERRLSSESAVGWVNVHLTITCSRKAFPPAPTAAITHVLTLLQAPTSTLSEEGSTLQSPKQWHPGFCKIAKEKIWV